MHVLLPDVKRDAGCPEGLLVGGEREAGPDKNAKKCNFIGWKSPGEVGWGAGCHNGCRESAPAEVSLMVEPHAISSFGKVPGI